MRGATFLAMACICGAASIPARSEEPVAATGKRLAAQSTVDWDVHDIEHRQLGPIRYAVQSGAIATIVQGKKTLSLAFVSCQKRNGKIAIELTNAPEADLAGGLRPTDMPRLVCNSLDPKNARNLLKSDIAARWEIGPLGDTLTRELSPADLRRCVAIDVEETVAPPPGTVVMSQRIAMEILPYHRALDAVFVACGETTAYGLAASPASARAAPPAATSASPPAASPASARAAPPAATSASPPTATPASTSASSPAASPAPPTAIPSPVTKSSASAQVAGLVWKSVRTIAKGKTIVRAAAGLDAAVVVKLDPGTALLAQQATPPWWAVKSPGGKGFQGFIREDRLDFD